MSKHTQGPWTQDKYGNVKTPSGGMLVTDGVALGCYSTAETRANARLIALSPEMLDALKDVHSHIADDALRTRIGNLIAKAEGATT